MKERIDYFILFYFNKYLNTIVYYYLLYETIYVSMIINCLCINCSGPVPSNK